MKSQQMNSQINNGLSNSLLNGDCIELLSRMASNRVDFVLTDPPYLAHYSSRDGRSVPNDDNCDWVKPAFQEIYRVLRWNRFCVSFYGWHKADKFLAAWREVGFRVIGHLTFIKRYVSTERFLRYQHENAYLLAKGNPQKPVRTIPDVLEWQYTGNGLHPTQKPLCILTPLIESFSAPGEVVLDPFCGSGSTLVAARQLNRRYIGIELDARYFQVARDRLRCTSAEFLPRTPASKATPGPRSAALPRVRTALGTNAIAGNAVSGAKAPIVPRSVWGQRGVNSRFPHRP